MKPGLDPVALNEWIMTAVIVMASVLYLLGVIDGPLFSGALIGTLIAGYLFLRHIVRLSRSVVTRTVEVDMVDPDGHVVEHGTCTVDITEGGQHMRARNFRSSARPTEDWPLPPGHSFVLSLERP